MKLTSLKSLLGSAVACLGVVAVFVLTSFFWYGNGVAVFTRITGRDLHFDNRTKWIKHGESKLSQAIAFKVTNVSAETVTILGMRTSCSCMLREQKCPVELKAYGSVSLSFTITKPPRSQESELFAGSISIYSSGSEPEILLSVREY